MCTASFGIAKEAYKFRKNLITKEEFLLNSQILCVEVSVSALSSILGHAVIPIPILGSVIGNNIGTFLYEIAKDNLTMKEVLWSPRGSGVRIKKVDYTPTLVAMTSMIPIYGPKSRMLTPRECARLQSFPENCILDKKDENAYKQLGNAVNVTMIERSARFLIKGESLFV